MSTSHGVNFRKESSGMFFNLKDTIPNNVPGTVPIVVHPKQDTLNKQAACFGVSMDTGWRIETGQVGHPLEY